MACSALAQAASFCPVRHLRFAQVQEALGEEGRLSGLLGSLQRRGGAGDRGFQLTLAHLHYGEAVEGLGQILVRGEG